MKNYYNGRLLRYLYPFNRKLRLRQFKRWIDDAVNNLDLSGKKVLVVGCGPGFEIPLLSDKVGAEGVIYAFDISEKMLDYARRNAKNNSVRNARIFLGNAEESVNFPENSYDFVFIVLGLSVFLNYKKTIVLAHSSLRANGKIIVFDSQAPSGLRGSLVALYNSFFRAHNRPIVENLRTLFVEELYKVYNNGVYFLWRGVKSDSKKDK